MNTVKRIVLAVLCGLFALALVGCGGNGNDPDGGGQEPPQKQEFTGITLNDASFTYDGEPHSLSISGTLPSGAEVSYQGNAQVNAGEYTVTATLTHEKYNTKELSATLTIVKADFSGIALRAIPFSMTERRIHFKSAVRFPKGHRSAIQTTTRRKRANIP